MKKKKEQKEGMIYFKYDCSTNQGITSPTLTQSPHDVKKKEGLL